MPKTKSAKKALRQNKDRRLRNIERKDKIKKEIKAFKKLIIEKKIEEAAKLLPRVMKVVDKVSKSGLIKKGKASRIKSRLSKKIKKA